MSESGGFEGSTPVGGIAVEVRLDETPYLKALAGLKARVAKNEGMPRLAMASTAQQAFAARWGMGGGGGGAATAPGGQARANWGTPGAGGGGGFWNPGWGMAPSPRVPPGPGRAAAAAANLGQPASPRRPRALRPKKPKGVKFTLGHNLLSAYSLAHIAEAVTQFASASIQATRDLKASMNNTMTITAMMQQRKAYETAAANVPLAGGLAIAGRGLVDSIRGTSQADIDRENSEAERNRGFFQERSDRDMARRVKAAENTAAGAKLFMGPGGSMAANLAVIEAQRKATAKQIADEADERLNKYQTQDKPNADDFMDYDAEGNRSLNQKRFDAATAEWRGKNDEIMSRRNLIKEDRQKDLALSNQQFNIQREQLIGGRRIAQQINPVDEALGAGSVRTGSLGGQDPETIRMLSRIVANTGEADAPTVGRN